ncbi:MAG: murein biosynthesis integral membrane protein MurJ [Eubacteriales bacterium]|nr:murein biosynthesis integral membrane protein MurJ [Eubacteriales bacterium]
MSEKSKKAVKTVSIITIAILMAKVLGMMRDVVFANYYGTRMESDAYLSASRLPLLFFDLALGAAVLSTFIPVFNSHLQKDRKKAFDFANTFLNIILLFSITFCVIGAIFAKQITTLYAPGLGAEGIDLSATLLIIMLPTALFTGVAYVFVGILQSLDEFTIPAIISLVSNGAVLVYLFFFNNKFGIYGMAVALTIAWSLQIIVQIPSLIKKGYRYKFRLNLKEEGLNEVFRLALPILVSSWVQPVCVVINTRFASKLGEGAIAGLEYANKLFIIIVGVFTFAITNYIFPALSRASASEDKKAFAGTMKIAFSSMFALIMPISIGMMLFAKPIVQVIYERGEFTSQSTVITAGSLTFFAIGMIGLGINEVLNKCFYAMQNGKTPMYASIMGILVNVIIAISLFYTTDLGVKGLALASSVALLTIAVFLCVKMNKVIKFMDRYLWSVIIRIIFATALMAIVSMTISHFTQAMAPIISLVLIVCIGGGVYIAAIFFTGVINKLKGQGDDKE